MEKEKIMICPDCRCPLRTGKPQRYETLCEHVTDPNKYFGGPMPPLRPAYYCKTKKCKSNSRHIFWNYYGDVYTGYGFWERIMIQVFKCYDFKKHYSIKNAIWAPKETTGTISYTGNKNIKANKA